MKETTNVEVRIEDGYAWITLDGASTRNALNPASAAALVEACRQVDSDPTVGVAVIGGRGGAFCSGAVREVLDGLAAQPSHVVFEELDTIYDAFFRVGRLCVPTIAAIDGPAVGAGLNLALATDLRVATERARLVSGFAKVGIHPGGGHLHLLNRISGLQSAAALGVFAQPLKAERAQELGLVWEVCSSESLTETVSSIGASLAADPDLARALKASLRLTAGPADEWSAAGEVERARQMWSLTRPRQ